MTTEKHVAARMPQATKDLWVKALRSGDYQQGTGLLYNPDQGGYCCLGVLQCVLENGKVEDKKGDLRNPRDPNSLDIAGLPSYEWASEHGIKDVIKVHSSYEEDIDQFNIRFSIQDNEFGVEPTTVEASELNDEWEWTFEQIADLVEEQVEGY